MKFPFNTDSYHNEPDEWISSFAVDDYNDRRIKLGLSSHYPDLHICKENKASGLSLYKMNGMIQNGDDYDVNSYNKVLEFFYLVLFDEKRFFISCSKCLVEVKSRVRQLKRFEDGRHDECFYQFESYLDERLTREIRGEYIYHIRGLCK